MSSVPSLALSSMVWTSSEPFASMRSRSLTRPLITERFRVASLTVAATSVRAPSMSSMRVRVPKPEASNTLAWRTPAVLLSLRHTRSSTRSRSMVELSAVSSITRRPSPSSHAVNVSPTRSCQPWPPNSRKKRCGAPSFTVLWSKVQFDEVVISWSARGWFQRPTCTVRSTVGQSTGFPSMPTTSTTRSTVSFHASDWFTTRVATERPSSTDHVVVTLVSSGLPLREWTRFTSMT